MQIDVDALKAEHAAAQRRKDGAAAGSKDAAEATVRAVR
jgi:hypothetical protein